MTLGNLLAQGGWAMWPIYLCSVVALMVFCERLFVFRVLWKNHLSWLGGLLERVRGQELQQAQALCAQQGHPVARVLGAAIKVAQARPDRVSAEAERVGLLELERYTRFLPLLAFVTQVAPLLGLLGTVLGMVKMFYGLQSSGMANVNVSVLSSGIWQAPLTTAAGLIVAAPSLAAHTYLSRRLDRLRVQMRDAVEQFLTALPYATGSGGAHRATLSGGSQKAAQGGSGAVQTAPAASAEPEELLIASPTFASKGDLDV